MAGRYLNCKSVGRAQPKPKRLLAVTGDQWQTILLAVEDSFETNPSWRRDYAIIFIGAALGMRRGEICLYERQHFRDLDGYDVIYVPTLKQSEKIQFTCPACSKRCRVKMASSGLQFRCPFCANVGTVPKREATQASGAVEVPVDIVEDKTKNFILDYIDGMRADQRYLFEAEGRPGYHLSPGHVNRIFNTYSVLAGLDPKISFHSLRHSRGVKIYSLFKDMKLCQNALRHKDIATTQVYANIDEEQKQHYRAELNKKAFDPLKKRKSK